MGRNRVISLEFGIVWIGELLRFSPDIANPEDCPVNCIDSVMLYRRIFIIAIIVSVRSFESNSGPMERKLSIRKTRLRVFSEFLVQAVKIFIKAHWPIRNRFSVHAHLWRSVETLPTVAAGEYLRFSAKRIHHLRLCTESNACGQNSNMAFWYQRTSRGTDNSRRSVSIVQGHFEQCQG